jgi:hypothetical protein
MILAIAMKIAALVVLFIYMINFAVAAAVTFFAWLAVTFSKKPATEEV